METIEKREEDMSNFANELALLMDSYGITSMEYDGWSDTIGVDDRTGERFNLGRDPLSPESLRKYPPEYGFVINHCTKSQCNKSFEKMTASMNAFLDKIADEGLELGDVEDMREKVQVWKDEKIEWDEEAEWAGSLADDGTLKVTRVEPCENGH